MERIGMNKLLLASLMIPPLVLVSDEDALVKSF